MEETKNISSQVLGKTNIKGTDIEYITTSEEFNLYDELKEVNATMFMISYERTNIEKLGRTIIFAYNRGPDSASIVLHIGGLGPKRISFKDALNMRFNPPFEMENNPDCILDICDIVFIDSVGCGYSHLLKDSVVQKYANSKEDAKSIVLGISNWLTKHNRWNSPIIILGVTFRS